MPFLSRMVVMVAVVTSASAAWMSGFISTILSAQSGSIPFRRARVGIVDHPAARVGQRADARHLVVVEREIEDRRIAFQPLDLLGARNHHDALLNEPAQAHLHGRLAVTLADLDQRRIARRAPARD